MNKTCNRGLLLIFGVLFCCTMVLTGVSYGASVAVGDFNNDGYADFAVLTARAVCVLLSNGDGTFQNARCFAAGPVPGPLSIVAGDVNNDGNVDLLTLFPERGPLASGVAVLLGNGDGTFVGPERLFPAGSYPRLFDLGDFNADGNLDIGVLGLGGPCLLLGNGDGSFGEPQCVFLRGFADAHTFFAADVRGNGRADFLAVNPSAICAWFRTTREPLCSPTRIQSRLAADGDFNADGLLDVATVGSTSAGTAVCIQTGDGTGFFQPLQCSMLATTVNITLVTAADLNGDGITDLVLAGSSRARGEAIVLLGNGDGSFQTSRFDVPIAPVLEGLAAGDFNADDIPDLVITGTGRACVFIGDGAGGFGEPQCFSTPLPPS